jgi:hypothetical protein
MDEAVKQEEEMMKRCLKQDEAIQLVKMKEVVLVYFCSSPLKIDFRYLPIQHVV